LRLRSIDLKYQRLTKKSFGDQPPIANQPPLRITFYEVKSLLHQALFQHYLQLSPPDLIKTFNLYGDRKIHALPSRISIWIIPNGIQHRWFGLSTGSNERLFFDLPQSPPNCPALYLIQSNKKSPALHRIQRTIRILSPPLNFKRPFIFAIEHHPDELAALNKYQNKYSSFPILKNNYVSQRLLLPVHGTGARIPPVFVPFSI
jgi:hypothetical protein